MWTEAFDFLTPLLAQVATVTATTNSAVVSSTNAVTNVVTGAGSGLVTNDTATKMVNEITSGNFKVSWFDFLFVIAVLFGLRRGRKRGLSEEILDVSKWLLVVGGCSVLYAPLARQASKEAHLSPFLANLVAYAMLMLLVFGVFRALKRLVGAKLVESDYFGGLEFVGGMIAGLVRYLCILLVFMAFMNARLYTVAERLAIQRAAGKELGVQLLPTFSALQADIFISSISGRFAKENLPFLLITPTIYDGQLLRNQGTGKKIEKAVDDLFTAPKRVLPTAPKKE